MTKHDEKVSFEAVDDAADSKLEAIHNFIDAHFACMELFEKEDKDPNAVTDAELDAALDLEEDALDDLVAAQIAYRQACKMAEKHEAMTEDEPSRPPQSPEQKEALDNFKRLRSKTRH